MLVICYFNPTITEVDSNKYETAENIDEFKRKNPYAIITYVFDQKQNLKEKRYGDSYEFNAICEKYGFSPNDYKRQFKDHNGHTARLINIRPKNRKYPCIIEDMDTNEIYKATPEFTRQMMKNH